MGLKKYFGNYNSSNFADKGVLKDENDNALSEITKGGRCNDCKFFSFGGYKCKKTDDKGNFVRKGMNPVIYTEPTQKGQFIHVIKPLDCNDFVSKREKKSDKKGVETE